MMMVITIFLMIMVIVVRRRSRGAGRGDRRLMMTAAVTLNTDAAMVNLGTQTWQRPCQTAKKGNGWNKSYARMFHTLNLSSWEKNDSGTQNWQILCSCTAKGTMIATCKNFCGRARLQHHPKVESPIWQFIHPVDRMCIFLFPDSKSMFCCWGSLLDQSTRILKITLKVSRASKCLLPKQILTSK